MYYSASYGAKETSSNVRDFIKVHKGDLWRLVRSVAPLLLILAILSIFAEYYLGQKALKYMGAQGTPQTSTELFEIMRDISLSVYTDPIGWFSIILQILIGYCFAVIAVSWHRLALLGPDRSEAMQMLSPQKHEINFVAVWTMVSVVLPHMMAVLMNMSMAYVLVSSVVFPYLFFKLSFYFPAKALDSHLSFKNSFVLTKGLFFKFMLSVFLSFWRIMLVLFVFSLVMGFIAGILAGILLPVEGVSDYTMGAQRQIVNQILMKLPVTFYFQPIFTVLGVTVLSNYYQYALQNKDEASNISI